LGALLNLRIVGQSCGNFEMLLLTCTIVALWGLHKVLHPFRNKVDPDPACHVDADPNPTFNYDADLDPIFQITAQNLEKVP
jgi:hypothetical protein